MERFPVNFYFPFCVITDKATVVSSLHEMENLLTQGVQAAECLSCCAHLDVYIERFER